ncbi:hypothetical protein LTR36_010909 [Oleoguttula mirabilis]|uniref:Uncharacterized protein n=1 Tax=Oleoguttula mirabilis TaxID=1507867 RepID=A0AAV9J3J5_9PEZI|nr:hypothetical protein LTR36_010909 [Oleoguttula mirabilis]
MKASIAATLAIALAGTSAQPHIKRQANPNVGNAIVNWQSDTSQVSSFLDSVQGYINSGDNAGFMAAASNAGLFENNEVGWKQILDAELCQTGDVNFDPGCLNAIAGANAILITDGTFGSVVNLLGDMANVGLAVAPADLFGINCGSATIGGRCFNVLPAITTYFTYAAYELCTYYGDCSHNGATAIYPQGCSVC